jgi:hypothetical protein
MHHLSVNGQPFPGEEALLTAWIRAVVAIVDVGVQVNVVSPLRRKLLIAIYI